MPVADGRIKGLSGEAVGRLQRVRCKVLAGRCHLQAAGELIAARQTSQSSSIMYAGKRECKEAHPWMLPHMGTYAHCLVRQGAGHRQLL